MDGSAAVIGTMMLPVLESADPGRAREPARQLGLAFQLTNFIRDVGEDAPRPGLPARWPTWTGSGWPGGPGPPGAHPRGPELFAFECARARAHYQAALPGVELLAPSSRPCIRAALELYGGILDELERRDYQVLRGRVRLSRRRKAAIFARHLTAAARGGPPRAPGRRQAARIVTSSAASPPGSVFTRSCAARQLGDPRRDLRTVGTMGTGSARSGRSAGGHRRHTSPT